MCSRLLKLIAAEHGWLIGPMLLVLSAPAGELPAQNVQGWQTSTAVASQLVDQGNRQQAEGELTKAIGMHPDAGSYNNRAQARFQNGDTPSALADYAAALAIDPKMVVAYYNRGRTLILQGEMDGRHFRLYAHPGLPGRAGTSGRQPSAHCYDPRYSVCQLHQPRNCLGGKG
jgi:tetratricopeptide (TPR) repeat protein